ncbi:MAG TPA: protein-L-isoaspartate o-methyltransferase 1 [Thermomicrobiales bacterium]|nr:protein-L-isoaspartate o-methyltransferase 1 [Thermomicrobiales bacterium]
MTTPPPGQQPQPLDEETATRIANAAVDEVGGPRRVYRNPRMAFSKYATRYVEVEGRRVEIRYGEISSPAIATVEGWVFEIHDEEIELLIRPAAPRDA